MTIKVLHIIDSGGLYGAEIMLLNLISEQIKLGLKPSIFSIGKKNEGEKPIEKEAIRRGFSVYKFRMSQGPNFIGAIQLLKFAEKNKYSLLHSHGYKGNILLGFLPKSVRRIPLVTTLHGWTNTFGDFKKEIYKWLDKASLNFIDAIVLVNKGMLDAFKHRNRIKSKFFIVNNGIPNNAIFSSLQQRHNVGLDQDIIHFCKKRWTVGTIGRLAREKGYDYLIRAISRMRKNNIDIQLVIIGEGEDRKRLEQIASENQISEKILMPGYRDDAKSYIPFFDIYTISSITEGLPITLLEAMQARIPIVATAVGGIPHVLKSEESGILVRPRDIEKLSDAIGRLFENRAYAESIVENAYQQVIGHYSSEQMGKEYLKIYRKLCKPSGRIAQINMV